MARKTNVRGRPGLAFIGIIVVCLVIFYLSWRSMMPSKPKPNFPVVDKEHVQDRLMFGNLDRLSEHRQDPHDSPMFKKLDRLSAERYRPSLQALENERGLLPKKAEVEAVVKDAGGKVEPVNLHEEEKARKEMEVMLENKKKIFEDAISDQKKKLDKPWFVEPDPSVVRTVTKMDKLVHLDLKGAAPKLSYLSQLFPVLSKLGATGLLVEYEDTFPYTGELKELAAGNAYSMEQIQEILQLAKDNKLMVMPLIQTFGHMEFVLKHEDKVALRETDYTPQVIDSSSPASYKLISAMVDQIVQAHPDITYLHIGCDEVYELGRGKSQMLVESGKASKHSLFIKHVLEVASMVKKHGITPIMWDDMLRKMEEDELKNTGLPGGLEVMIWNYALNVSKTVNLGMLEKYSTVFKNVWIASAFKGSKDPNSFYTEPEHQLMNHISWLSVIKSFSSSKIAEKDLGIRGIALTGWQRFDHFAALCELFPVAIPSLAVCLAAFNNGGFTEEIYQTASHKLRCSNMIEMNMPEVDKKTQRAIVTQDCRFPGHEIFYLLQELSGLTRLQENLIIREKGWATSYHVRHHFTNNGIMKMLDDRLNKLTMDLEQIKPKLEGQLLKIYTNDTVEEWMEENIETRLEETRHMALKVNDLIKFSVWDIRPLPSRQDNRTSKKAALPVLSSDQARQRARDFSRSNLLNRIPTNDKKKDSEGNVESSSMLRLGKLTRDDIAVNRAASDPKDYNNQSPEAKLPGLSSVISNQKLPSLSAIGDWQQAKQRQDNRVMNRFGKENTNFLVGSNKKMSELDRGASHRRAEGYPALPNLDERNAERSHLDSGIQNSGNTHLSQNDVNYLQRRHQPDALAANRIAPYTVALESPEKMSPELSQSKSDRNSGKYPFLARQDQNQMNADQKNSSERNHENPWDKRLKSDDDSDNVRNRPQLAADKIAPRHTDWKSPETKPSIHDDLSGALSSYDMVSKMRMLDQGLAAEEKQAAHEESIIESEAGKRHLDPGSAEEEEFRRRKYDGGDQIQQDPQAK